QRGAASAFGAEPFGDHADNVVKFGTGQVAVWKRGADEVEQFVFLGIFDGNGGDDLLSEDVEGFRGDFEKVQFTPAHRAKGGDGFHQFVAGQGKQPSFGQAAAAM